MKLRQIKGGWAASGDGWAVHGATQEEATERFHEAECQRAEIAKRPYWYEVYQAAIAEAERQLQAHEVARGHVAAG